MKRDLAIEVKDNIFLSLNIRLVTRQTYCLTDDIADVPIIWSICNQVNTDLWLLKQRNMCMIKMGTHKRFLQCFYCANERMCTQVHSLSTCFNKNNIHYGCTNLKVQCLVFENVMLFIISFKLLRILMKCLKLQLHISVCTVNQGKYNIWRLWMRTWLFLSQLTVDINVNL